MYQIAGNKAILHLSYDESPNNTTTPMTIAVINDDGSIRNLAAQIPDTVLQWSYSGHEIPAGQVDATFAIVMNAPDDWIQELLVPALICETDRTLTEMGCQQQSVGRFCGWPGMMERKKWEVAVANDAFWLEAAGYALNRQLVAVADKPGLVAPRILATIINEACYTLADKVCSEEDLDTAMKLGTNYPQGPMAWMASIGKEKIASLLSRLAIEQPRYQPHPILQTAG